MRVWLNYVKLKSLLMLKSHLNLFHALKLSINFYNMNEVLYLKSVKIIAKIKLNGKENKCKMWEVIFKLRAVSIRSYKAAWRYDILVFLYLSILANAREGLTFTNMVKGLTHQLLCLQLQGTGNPAFADLKEGAYIISCSKKFSRYCSFPGSMSSFHWASVLRRAPDKAPRSWVWHRDPIQGRSSHFFLTVSFTSSILSHHTPHISQARLSSFARIYIIHSQEKWDQHGGPKPALVSRWPSGEQRSEVSWFSWEGGRTRREGKFSRKSKVSATLGEKETLFLSSIKFLC